MNRKAALLVMGVFLLGMAVGAVGFFVAEKTVLSSTRPSAGKQWPSRTVEELTERCNLTPVQQEQLRTILEETRKRYDAIYEPIRPAIEQARQDGRTRIRNILTPEQLPKFEEYLRTIDERRKRDSGR
jgi:uncharacterized membrane protein